MSRRVLLAWEMGAGLGHTRRLLVLAGALKARGYEPVIAQRNLHTLADEVRGHGYPMIPIPPQVSLAPKDQPFRAMTYADIMAICGYAQPGILEPLLDAWDGLLAMIDPVAIVGDYCPILPMAARGRYPFLAFGDGFVVPPYEPDDFPDLRPSGDPIKPVRQILEDVNALLNKRGQAAVRNLGELVAGDDQAVITLPELDIYHQHRTVPALGPLDELPPVRTMPTRPNLFIYLAADYHLTRKVLQSVVDSKVPAEAFIRDASPELRQTMRNARITVHDTPPPLSERLQDATMILHHGGMGTLETALAMGCPQLLLPRHLEQSLNASNLRQRKIAEKLTGDDMDAYRKLITAAMQSEGWHQNIHALGERLNQRRPFSCLDRVIAKVDALAA